jgi:hypothetical protein
MARRTPARAESHTLGLLALTLENRFQLDRQPTDSGIIGQFAMAGRMWRCAKCGRRFANRHQSHACGRYSLARHFAGKPPSIRALFERVVAEVRALGPVTVLPEKTRIAFQVRMSFAQLTPRQRWIDGHVVLARRMEHARFRRIETISPRNHVHVFRLERPEDVDDTLRAWLREAYAVGEQRHVRPARATPPARLDRPSG